MSHTHEITGDAQGTPLLQRGDLEGEVDPRLVWQETFDEDSDLLADIVRYMSNNERLIDRDGLYRALQDALRAKAVYEAGQKAEAGAAAADDGRDAAASERETEHEPERKPAPVKEPARYIRRDVLGMLLRMRHKKMAGDDEPQPFPGDPDEEVAELMAFQEEKPGAATDPESVEARQIELEYFDALLPLTLSANEDLAVLHGLDGGVYYHCKLLLSASYAKLLTGLENPPMLLAESIRNDSREYPRPVAVEFFECPPFNFSPQQLSEILGRIADEPEYADITFVESSVGTVYLYSEKYMDKDYASYLANNIDLGLIKSP